MRIAIVTLHGYFNYGNRLQNYALQRILEKEGHKVTTIASERSTSILKRIFRKYTTRLNNKIVVRNFREVKRENSIKSFSEKNIKTQVYKTDDLLIPHDVNRDFDVFIVGSDQVWNPYFWEDSDESIDLRNYFLEFTQKKKIAYAASFGVSKIDDKWADRILPLINRFDAVSVREIAGQSICQSVGCSAKLVIDPTLLLDVSEWRMIENKYIKESNYIVLFFLGDIPQTAKEEAERIAGNENLKIINIMDERNPYYTGGPDVFLSLIDKADYVFTDSFHASVFSILFHTTFAVFDRNQQNYYKMGSRIQSLLSILGEPSGISNDTIKLINNFEIVDSTLQSQRNEAISFLREAINKEGD